MKSIRQYLQKALLVVMLSIMGLAAGAAYFSSTHEIDEVFDARLAQYTRLLASYQWSGSHSWVPVPEKHEQWVGHKYEAKISFQIWSDDKQLLEASENALREPLGPYAAGFHSVQSNGKPMRIFVLPVNHRWYMAAERLEIRNELVHDIALIAVFPAIAGTAIVMLLMGWLMSRSFLPLQQLADAIVRRRADDLTTLSLDAVPLEVQPLVDNLNILLSQVKASLEREKRFSADAAHELKTPITALKLRIANMQACAGYDETFSLQQLAISVDDIQRIVEQLLLLSRLEPRRMEGVWGAVALLPLSRAVLAQEADLALDKQQELQLDSDDEAVSVIGDATLLQLLLRNLVHNAVLYTQSGGNIGLSIRRSGAQVIIEVSDDGPGIPSAEYGRVFDRFYRGNGDGHESGTTGSGLGLSIVKEITRLHGGTVQLQEGAGGKGLCVSVVLPSS